MSILWSKRPSETPEEPKVKQETLVQEPTKQVWAVGGGKGGVGKTLIAANLGILLSREEDKRVILVDLDLGGANLHTCIGLDQPKFTLSDFVQRDVDNLENLVVETPIKNLGLISGAQDFLDIANIKPAQKQRFLTHLKKLKADYVILDLGAGTTFNTLDFFLASDVGIITLVPEPTSIENVYRFVKSAFYRKLKTIESTMQIKQLIDGIMHNRVENNVNTPADLLNQIELLNPAVGEKVRKEVQTFAPKLIMNMIRTHTDAELALAVSSVCKKYFGVEIELLGCIEYDNMVWQSVRKKAPILLEFPNSKLVSNFNKIYKKLINPNIKFLNNASERM